MHQPSSWLPVTVVAAIAIFCAKEILEGFRKWRSNSRKITALKTMLARECELNFWVLTSVLNAVESAAYALESDPIEPFLIDTKPGSYEQWRRLDLDGDLKQGGGLPPVKKSMMDGSALVLAEINRPLFELLENALNSVSNIDHVRGSLINFSRSEDRFEQRFFQAFPDWAKGELIRNYAALNELYKACCGSPLRKGRLR